MMWRRSLRRPGLAGLPAASQLSRDCPPFHCARGEAEDLDLDAAALQRARQDIGAAGGDHDRAAAHRAGIVEQQCHHRVAEVGVALLLEGQRLQRVGDDAGEPRGVEHALFEVEVPGAVLLRHQAALQPVREAADGHVQEREMLVQEGAQPLKLFDVAEGFGADGLVELAREGVIAERFRGIEHGYVGPARRLSRFALSLFPAGLVILFRAFHGVAFLAALGNFRVFGLVLLASLFLLLLAAFGLGFLLLGAVAVVLVLALLGGAFHQLQGNEQIPRELREGSLIVHGLFQALKQRTGLVLDPGAPGLHNAVRAVRRLLPSQHSRAISASAWSIGACWRSTSRSGRRS